MRLKWKIYTKLFPSFINWKYIYTKQLFELTKFSIKKLYVYCNINKQQFKMKTQNIIILLLSFICSWIWILFNRPGVAGAVLQSPPSLINSLIHSFTDALVQISSKHCQSQTGRARELKFWENGHPTQCVLCHVSRVTCHLSGVTCHLSHVIFFNIFFYIKEI